MKHQRNCPNCHKILTYVSKWNLDKANRLATPCSSCRQVDSVKEFVKKARNFHGDLYDYSLVTQFKNELDKVTIICHLHGPFQQTVHDHKVSGCRRCGLDRTRRKLSFPTSHFIERAVAIHGDKYGYSNVNYVNNRTKINLVCRSHGDFWQSPDNHLSKRAGCPKCAAQNSYYTQEQFLAKARKIHGNLYDYSRCIYKRNDEKVIILCSKHGEFEQSPDGHLMGKGCQRCIRKEEHKLELLLRSEFPGWEILPQEKIYSHIHQRFRYFDFVLRKDNVTVIVEYDGKQHFMPVRFGGISVKRAEQRFKKQKQTDQFDEIFCRERGIMLFRVKYDENKFSKLEVFKCLMQKISV